MTADVVGVVATVTGVVGIVGVGVVCIEEGEVDGRTILLLGTEVVGSVLVTVVDGLVLAIALDDEAAIDMADDTDDTDAKDAEVTELTSEEEEEEVVATGALVAILVVLEDMVNCLTTKFLGFFLKTAIVSHSFCMIFTQTTGDIQAA